MSSIMSIQLLYPPVAAVDLCLTAAAVAEDWVNTAEIPAFQLVGWE